MTFLWFTGLELPYVDVNHLEVTTSLHDCLMPSKTTTVQVLSLDLLVCA